MIKGLLLGGLCLPLLSLVAQPQADLEFNFPIQHPQYTLEKGPKVFIDGAHHNYHTYEGGFSPFAKLLEQDGYQVQASNQPFDNDLLNQCQILVIANPLNEDDLQGWVKPNPPAFTKAEVKAVKTWVKAGGSLLLIADHMPFPGAASNLAKAFGFQFSNGFAMPAKQKFPTSIFDRTTGSLHDNDITNGQLSGEKIDQIATFTGSAFQSPEGATPILSFGEDHTSIEPDTAWQFHPYTPRINLKNWHQGAYLPFGKGRIVVYGEAAMLTAQIAQGKFKVGFNHPKAKQNAQLVLNTIHWLDQAKHPTKEE